LRCGKVAVVPVQAGRTAQALKEITMDHTGDRRQLVRVQVTAVVIAAAIAAAVLAMGALPSQAGAPATDHAADTGGNGVTGYFPDVFVNQGSVASEHIATF
jgi:hypothetical protein